MRETSIVASLDELKLIHMQRLADERAAIARARAARDAESHAREQARRDAETAERQALLDAELRVHTARQAAERDARVRAETEQATEQARLDAQLAAERDAGERSLRREAILRQRPRWMIALTIAALIGTAVFGFSAAQHARDIETARAREAVAQQQRDEAKRDAQAATAQVAALETKLAALNDEVARAVARVGAAKQDIDRKSALDALVAARKKVADAEIAHANAVRIQAEKARKAGIHNDAKCLGSVLGCIDK
ncbi:MAG TPA: hypothetical protein VGG28_00445 [Kofleriaceae bacterium]|jgi:hypothetical protein